MPDRPDAEPGIRKTQWLNLTSEEAASRQHGSGPTPTPDVSEPPPARDARELFPDDLADTPSGAFLCFLFFVLQADG
jgi:hypothetical protein